MVGGGGGVEESEREEGREMGGRSKQVMEMEGSREERGGKT